MIKQFIWIVIVSLLMKNEVKQESYSFEFSQLNTNQYKVVNDDVMGGRSESELVVLTESANFKGSVSLENNGGFASVRMLWPFSISASIEQHELTVVVLKVKGDGQIYQFRLRTDQGFEGAAYSYSFKTLKDQMQTVHMPLGDFVATFRGKTLPDIPALKLTDVQQMALLVADTQVGSFSLKLHELTLK